MGYPPEPEEPGSDKFSSTCGFLLFNLFMMYLIALCIFSGGLLLIYIIPFLIPTVIIAHFVEKRAKSPTIRQIAMYYQFQVMGFGCLVVFVGGLALAVMIGKRL